MGPKKHKTTIEFDPLKRKEYLTGFRKRKEARKRVARENIARDIKEDIKTAKAKAREKFHGKQTDDTKSAANRVVPEIEHLLPQEIKDFGSHTVAVTALESLYDLKHGKKKKKEEGEESGSEEEEEEEDEGKKRLTKMEQRNLNRLVHKQIQQSSAFKAHNVIKGKKDAKRSRFESNCKKKKGATKREKHFHPKKESR